MDAWEKLGLYRRTRMLSQLQERFQCITFDKREAGESGGRVERVSWSDYVRQGVGLLDHLGLGRVHVMGACVGCSIAACTASTHRERVAGGMVLYSPAGGVRYRRKQLERFRTHLAYAAEHGLAGVADLAATTDGDFFLRRQTGPVGQRFCAPILISPRSTVISAAPPSTRSQSRRWALCCSTATPCLALNPMTYWCRTCPRSSCRVKMHRMCRRPRVIYRSVFPSTSIGTFRSRPRPPKLHRRG